MKKHRAAYMAAAATIFAAIIGVTGSFLISQEGQLPTASIKGDGNNLNVIQDARDVTIHQNINEISKLREYEASSYKQSLVSGCNTMLDYFVNWKNFNVDSIDTLVGGIWVQKEKYISYYGPESQRKAMEIIIKINPLYLKWIPGLYAMHNQEQLKSSIVAAGADKATETLLKRAYEVQPMLVLETEQLCTHLENLVFMGG